MDKLNLDEIYGIWETSFWQTFPGYGIIFIIFIFVLIILGLIFKGVFFSKKMLTPFDKAKKELDLLLKSKVISQRDKEITYLKLSKILREYIQNRYYIDKPGMTDLEFLSELENIEYNVDLKDFLKIIVFHAQAVKFSHVELSVDEITKDISNSILFLDSTNLDKNKIK